MTNNMALAHGLYRLKTLTSNGKLVQGWELLEVVPVYCTAGLAHDIAC